MWCGMAAQENRVDGTVGAGFKPAYITAAPQNSPNSPICVVLQLAPEVSVECGGTDDIDDFA